MSTRIGFVDYYLDEWHANHYPKWIRALCEASGADFTVAYAWAELDEPPTGGRSTATWCEEMGIARCATIDELCQRSDCIVILAPSDPQTHLAYAQAVFPYGKPTYVDKTFAPDGAVAEAIFALAAAHGTPFFSTSALRYATELEELRDVLHLTVGGSGSNFPEYSIHLAELAVKLLPMPVTEVKVTSLGGSRLLCSLRTAGEASATLLYSPSMAYFVDACLADGKHVWRALKSDFFAGLMRDMLRFFESRTPSFDPAQTLAVAHLRETLLIAAQSPDAWVAVRG